MSFQKGFQKVKTTFWDIIRNPIYCGKIYVRRYKDKEAQIVPGQHESIISEALYYDVQDVLDGRKRGQYKLKVAAGADMPLRGSLICPTCGKILTGSALKGRRKYYSYYHCTMGCKTRFKADVVNNSLVSELSKYSIQDVPSVIDGYKILLTRAWSSKTEHIRNGRKQILEQIKTIEGKLSHIRDLLRQINLIRLISRK
jgi:site-specific DNA recombinase